MEATYPYAIKNQRIQEMPLVGGFGCLELVLYGIRELAEQHYVHSKIWSSTNESGEDYMSSGIKTNINNSHYLTLHLARL